MKKFNIIFIVSLLLAGLCSVGCQEESEGLAREYIMFADTLATYPVIENGSFSVPVVSTVKCSYDRTFGVEVIDGTSNAIENLHYRLKSNTIVIPAGQNRAEVEVEGLWNNIDASDSLGFTLRLIIPEDKQMPVYGSDEKYGLETKCVLMKSCNFNIDAYCGYAVLTSMYLYNYSIDGAYQKLVWTEKTGDKSILCHDIFYDGYDLEITFHPEDPMNPYVTVGYGQEIGDEWTAFGIIRGDNRIRVEDSEAYPSFIYPCQNSLTVSMRFYVSALGGEYGTVGHYYNVMEWVSEEEAERLVREDGMTMPKK